MYLCNCILVGEQTRKMSFFEFYDRWQGLIFIVGGIYGLLLAYKILPKNPKDPKRMELWHKKFGKVMKILSPIIIISGILSLTGFFQTDRAISQKELLEHVNIIRQKSGTPDKTGWYHAQSTNGGYSVYFPSQFGEIESPPTEEAREKIYSYIMASKTISGKFTAIFMKYINGIPDVTKHKNDVLIRSSKTPQIVSVSESEFNNFPLIKMEMKIDSESSKAFTNIIITGDGAYQLTAEFESFSVDNEEHAKKFFNSFELTK